MIARRVFPNHISGRVVTWSRSGLLTLLFATALSVPRIAIAQEHQPSASIM